MRARAPILATLALALAAPAAAEAHAVLESTRPGAGSSLASAPAEVSVRFDEPVEATFGAVRVFDPEGSPVPTGELVHEQPEEVAVSLPEELPDGVYTATYRVVSADSHPVSGGFTFTVGDPGAAPAVGVGELVDEAGAGPVTDFALGVARVGTYAATALLLGGVAFLVFAFAPAIAAVAGGGYRWAAADAAFAARLRRLLVLGVALGIAASAAGLALQAATALGGSFWDALRPSVISDELSTRFGTVWGLRLVDFALLGGLIVAPGLGLRARSMAPARLGADGLAPAQPLPASHVATAFIGLGLGFLAIAPALAGHPGVTDPRALSLAAGFAHVLAFSLWLGGLAAIAGALPAATAELAPPDRTRLLAASLARFSSVALGAVAVLLATGVVQSILQLDALGQLVDSGYGRAILAKAALLAILVGLGARNRASLRRLDAQLAEGRTPGRAGVELRRAIRAEVALIGVVLAVTAVLAATSPPAAGEGPFSGSAELGPANLELTVDPARRGSNQIHLYLFDSVTGTQFEGAKEVTVTAAVPDAGVAGLDQPVRQSGPGHYVVRGAELAIAGEWELEVAMRTSAFDRFETTFEVPIR